MLYYWIDSIWIYPLLRLCSNNVVDHLQHDYLNSLFSIATINISQLSNWVDISYASDQKKKAIN